MSTQVLARKWRPRDFASLVGQEHVVRALTHALEQQRLHHAYLFTGTRGVGKTTLSRILAKALNCTGTDGRGGITSTPCNQCDACTAIDAGRFVDYIELDAASNRGVDEMTTLLERAIYAPSNARFKVYMIDEVHMLTTHAFNAMLKTLEEPPDYVKFILATTDPQKIPVTVLSRCLQFNLKQMSPQSVAARLAEVLQSEEVDAEPLALRLIGTAARGSMRDGLSLLDQAIAYSAGRVTADAVRSMLGAIDTTLLVRVLDALAARDAPTLLALADEMSAHSFSFGQGLRDLASLLHRIALVQQLPGSARADGGDADDESRQIARLAGALAPEEVQLYYQIALHGRNDLHLAPDEYAGFTMTLLRMLAFTPDAGPGRAAARAAPAALVAGKPPRTAMPASPAAADLAQARVPARAGGGGADGALAEAARPATDAGRRFDGDWPALASRLAIGGFTRELASRAELVAHEGDHFRLRVPVKTLADRGNIDRLKAALAQHFGRPVRVSVDVGATVGPTVAALSEQAQRDRQKRAEESIYGDPVVRQLMDNFGAEIEPGSIRPIEP